jgi:hypothetical protein
LKEPEAFGFYTGLDQTPGGGDARKIEALDAWRPHHWPEDRPKALVSSVLAEPPKVMPRDVLQRVPVIMQAPTNGVALLLCTYGGGYSACGDRRND